MRAARFLLTLLLSAALAGQGVLQSLHTLHHHKPVAGEACRHGPHGHSHHGHAHPGHSHCQSHSSQPADQRPARDHQEDDCAVCQFLALQACTLAAEAALPLEAVADLPVRDELSPIIACAIEQHARAPPTPRAI